jgi:PAS domain S-box-containing protein
MKNKSAPETHFWETNQFESLVTNIPGIIYRCNFDHHWTMLFISSGIEKISGYKAEDLLLNAKVSFASIIFADDMEMVSDAIDKAINANQVWEIEYRICRKDGTVCWVMEKGRAVIDEDENISYLDGFILDINDRKEAEQKLKESDAYHRSMSENIPDMVFEIDDNGVFLSFKADEKDLYSKPDQFLGKKYNEIFPPDITREMESAISKTLASGEATDLGYELEIGQKKHYYQARITAFGDSKLIVLVRDVTAQRIAESELISLSNLQNILLKIASEYINLPIAEIEEATARSLAELGRFVNADRTYIFDYDWEKQVCNNTHEWCEEGIEPQINDLQGVPLDIIPYWVETHLKGETMYIPDVFALNKDDGVRQILEPQEVKSLITIPMMEQKKCLGFIGFDSVRTHHKYTEKEKVLLSVFSEMLVNIRHRIQLEKNLIAEKQNADIANRAKSEFLANMSHEIRTPMNSILGFSEIMLNTTNNQQQQNYLRTILSSGKSLLTLINDVLDLSKIEAGRMEISPEAADVRLIVNEIKQLFKHKLQEKNIEFHVEFEDDFPETIIIDEVRLRQILLNLCGNAVKFTEKGRVEVNVNILNNRNGHIDFEIIVSDSGIGIPEQDQQRIFESFSQQTGQDNKRYGGTGLGLTISKRLAELMGGEIQVESQIGEGSRFSVRFFDIKYSDEIIDHEGAFLWEKQNIDFKGSKILIVDDVPHNRNLVMTYLKDYNLKLFEAENGEIAIEYAKIYQPDLIFMDIRMPGINGYEATVLIKKEQKLQDIPIIALTASTMRSELNRLKESFDGYLRKPVQKNTVINELIKHLPYESPEKTSVKTTESENQAIKARMSPRVQDKFKKAFNQAIDKQINYVMIDDLKELVESLQNFAIEHDLLHLKNMAAELKGYIDTFDFEEISVSLKEIKQLYND